jgi:hypothetical protein
MNLPNDRTSTIIRARPILPPALLRSPTPAAAATAFPASAREIARAAALEVLG